MFDFQTFEDVEEWLAPMGYEAFWAAILSTGLYTDADRAHCDTTLKDGIADMDTVMEVTKRMALHQLTDQFDLPFRCERKARPALFVVH